jgi:LmbE family N-acetylglucosaminyl deacetylase
MDKIERCLVLAPHTDDGEFGCGASIVKLLSYGIKVYYAAFSIAEESVPDPYPKDVLDKEVRLAMKELGIEEENLLIYKYKVRNFAYKRQEILEDLVNINKILSPDIVFMPSIKDLHQDHTTIANEGLRAFKNKSILCYELPWNNIEFSNNCFISFTENELNKKVNALMCYESQKDRPYASAEFIKSLAITRGTQIGTKYAEVFEVMRWIIN